MSPEETAWLAGILEGEGCFDRNRGDARYPRVRIEMKDRDIIARVKRLAGGGRITKKKGKKAQHSTTYVLLVCAKAEVRSLLNQIYPWMSHRRKCQITELMLGAGWI